MPLCSFLSTKFGHYPSPKTVISSHYYKAFVIIFLETQDENPAAVETDEWLAPDITFKQGSKVFSPWNGVRTFFLMPVADCGHQCPMPRPHLNTKGWDTSLHRHDAWHPRYLQMAGCAEIAFGIKLNVVESKLVICPSWLLWSTSPLCCLEV